MRVELQSQKSTSGGGIPCSTEAFSYRKLGGIEEQSVATCHDKFVMDSLFALRQMVAFQSKTSAVRQSGSGGATGWIAAYGMSGLQFNSIRFITPRQVNSHRDDIS